MLDELTRREIDKVTERILREVGLASPPIRVEALLEHLRVHRDFYDLQDPNLLQRFLAQGEGAEAEADSSCSEDPSGCGLASGRAAHLGGPLAARA